MIIISRECFVEPEIHEKIRKMPSGRRKVISKRGQAEYRCNGMPHLILCI